MNRNKTLSVLLVGSCSLMLACSTGWQIKINGTANRSDFARAVTVTNEDDVVAAGFTENANTGFGLTVVKFSGRQGKELWRRVISGVLSTLVTQALAVKTDDAGDVLAAGFIFNTEPFDDLIVVKFDGVNGAELWRQVIDGSGNGTDAARSVVLDRAGNVIAAGHSSNSSGFREFTVIKFDGRNGAEVWRQTISSSNPAGSEAAQLALDARGDVLAVGYITNQVTGADFAVVKFDGVNGAIRWRKTISGTLPPALDLAHAVAVDLTGDVVAAGYLGSAATSDDFIVVKLDGVSGAELWRTVINGTANERDRASAVAVDAGGNVFAAGYLRNAGNLDDFAVMKLDGVSGAELWRQMINGTSNRDDSATAVAVDIMGHVIAAGATDNRLTGTDFTILKCDDMTGRELWRTVINGTANGVDVAFAIATDSAGNVVAAGRTENIGTGDDFTVVKLTGTEGSDF